MSTDTEFQQTAQRLQKLGQAAITREEKQKRQRSLDRLGVPAFGRMVKVCFCAYFRITLADPGGASVHAYNDKPVPCVEWAYC